MDLVREFKGAPEFKDGWYYRLADGHPWIGPFVTGHMAGLAREHVTSNAQDVWSKPPWLKISTSVALGRLSLIPPRGGPAFQIPSTSRHTVPVALPSRHTVPAALSMQSSGYQARPRLALATRREVPSVRDESAAPQPAIVPRRRGSRPA